MAGALGGGVDVSGERLEIALRPARAGRRAAIDAAGIVALVARLDWWGPALHPHGGTWLETTGGGERGGQRALAATRRKRAIRAFYERRCAARKPGKVATAACTRELLTIRNVLLHRHTSRQDRAASAA